MDELNRTAEKLDREFEIMMLLVEQIEQAVTLHETQISLAVSQTKRVRRDVNLLIRLLAALRDKATSQEATSE